MSADACVAFYGLRYEVRPDEIEALEQLGPANASGAEGGIEALLG